jgi:hypothetical protein
VGSCVGKLIVAVIRTDGNFGVGTLRIDVTVSQNGEGEVVRPEVGYVVIHGGARGVGVTKSIVCVELLDDDTQSAL